MTREEALDLCVKEVKEVHEKYSYLQEGLVEELCARLTWSGAEVTAYLNEWRDATEFYDRQARPQKPELRNPVDIRRAAYVGVRMASTSAGNVSSR